MPNGYYLMANISDQQILEGQLRTEQARREVVSERNIDQSEDAQLAQEQEIEYANDLAQEQDTSYQARLTQELYNEGMVFGGASGLKWGGLMFLGAVNDAIDLLALTGVLEIFSWLISIGLTALILIIIWLTDTNMKRAQSYTASIGERAGQIASMVERRVRRTAAHTQRRLNKIPGLKKISIRGTARKNPLARVALGGFFESIPFLGALNLITIWIFFGYLAERHALKAARESAEDAYNQLM